jgi:hypothetical protein
MDVLSALEKECQEFANQEQARRVSRALKERIMI